ncbi:MAG: chorismate mutase [Ignavibacteriaceae bacterium]|nr:chorismate mutase [Ignavibacteriaceae bacterium]
MNRIAIQGFTGSFHHEAVELYFGTGTEIVECATFRETFNTAADPELSDGGLIAIENSIAGSILPNYNLLQKSKLHITGEIYLQIRQNLLANHGVTLDDIREVQSHPMALLQCSDFLEKHRWKLVETEDTALSAKNIKMHHSTHIAAIAGRFAAKLYSLNILASNIHTVKKNYTRFLVLKPSKEITASGDENKASLYFETEHKKGSLAAVLTTVADNDINLSKLQSFPIPGSDWKYYFHADMEFTDVDAFNRTVTALRNKTAALKVYGIYKKGVTYG